jgi:hypothetical protein
MHEPILHRSSTTPATRLELRAFGLTVGGAFVVLAAFGVWRGRTAVPTTLAVVGLSLLAAGLLAPARLGRVHGAWMALAHAMSRVTTPLFMSVVYVAVLTPLGLAMRAAGRRPLARKRDAATFWVDRPPAERRSDLHRQF